MSKKVSVRFNFPATKIVFPYIVTPDTEYDEGGIYQVTLVYDKETAEDLKKKIEKLDPRLQGLIEYQERDDGTCNFKVKQKRFLSWMKDGIQQTTEMTPTVLNADNSKYEGQNPWGGTIAEVGCLIETQKGARGKGTIAAYRLKGVRIHELVSGGAGEGDGDPLFGGPVANQKVEKDTFDDLPFDVDGDDDDAPI